MNISILARVMIKISILECLPDHKHEIEGHRHAIQAKDYSSGSTTLLRYLGGSSGPACNQQLFRFCMPFRTAFRSALAEAQNKRPPQ